MGPLLNLEGRFHFSLVEWFAHCHEDVFGDLEYIDDGADTLPNAFAPALLTTPASAPRSTRSSRARTASPSATATRSATRGIVDRRRVHRDRPVRAPAAHGDRAASTSTSGSRSATSTTAGRTRSSCSSAGSWWVEDDQITHGVDRHRPRDPARRLHAGRPGPGHRQGRAHRLLRLGAGQHGVQHAQRGRAHRARRWRTWPRSIPRRRARSSSGSRTTGRWTATPAASVRSSGRTR